MVLVDGATLVTIEITAAAIMISKHDRSHVLLILSRRNNARTVKFRVHMSSCPVASLEIEYPTDHKKLVALKSPSLVGAYNEKINHIRHCKIPTNYPSLESLTSTSGAMLRGVRPLIDFMAHEG